ncbi:dehypoxanthine futalosine cyclase [Pyrodictium delaneyi]|uniref:Dehypoxanthine futalosine cyclase n=1 Tax=Pyrodictium delaneyi TaxID=1273541 RepID=A0A211YPS5_9CREN|nr:dehypoxanthine futalosine cyclase [Pyrodictium delaneyi]
MPRGPTNYLEEPRIRQLLSVTDELGYAGPVEHVLEGKPSVHDIVELYRMPLWLLGSLARAVTDAITGRRVGYVVNMILNYTNICVVNCRFCAFRRQPGAPDAYRLDASQAITSVVEHWEKYHIRQVLFQGGVDPSTPLEYFEEVFRGIKSRTRGEVAIHGLSAVEIDWYSKLNRISVKELVSRLAEAGLDSVPGAGAEILSPRVRSIISPLKTTAERWLEVMDEIMKLGLPVSTTMMYGHMETLWERAEHLLALLRLQRRRGLIMAFIAWNFEPGNTELQDTVPYPAGGTELLRNVAVARLVFRHEIPWIQAGWLTAGTRLGQVSLDYGANDWGGTLYGEKVLPAAGVPLPLLVRRSIERVIGSAGYEPYERDNWYYPVETTPRIAVSTGGVAG